MYPNFDPYNFTNLGGMNFQYPMYPYAMQSYPSFIGVGFSQKSNATDTISNSDTTKTSDTVSFKSNQTQPLQNSASEEAEKKGLSASAIIGISLGIAVVGAAFVLHKGSKALEGNGSIKEKFEAGWKKLRGKEVKVDKEEKPIPKVTIDKPSFEVKPENCDDFILHDISLDEPAFEKSCKQGYKTDYYNKNNQKVMSKDDKGQTHIYKYDNNKCVQIITKDSNGTLERVEYLIEGESLSARHVFYDINEQKVSNMEILEFDKQGKIKIRYSQDKSGKFHSQEFIGNNKHIESYTDGTIVELSTNKDFTYDITVIKNGKKNNFKYELGGWDIAKYGCECPKSINNPIWNRVPYDGNGISTSI